MSTFETLSTLFNVLILPLLWKTWSIDVRLSHIEGTLTSNRRRQA
jgi:hypothetical protein